MVDRLQKNLAGCTSGMKRILLFKPGAIGDLLQITPVIKALHNRYPESLVSVMVGNKAAVPIFSNNPGVHEVLVYDRKGEHSSVINFANLFLEVHKRKFDIVINFQRSNIRGWMLLLAAMPAKYLIYKKAKNRTVHAVVNHLETLVTLGIKPDDIPLRLDFFPGVDAEKRSEEIFEIHRLNGYRVIALNPGASHAVNRWSTRQFAELSDLIHEESNSRVILVGGAADRALADDIAGHAKNPVVDLVGLTDIETTGAVLKRCDLLVSGDTGPMHLATAVGTPVVALFGAADPQRTGPIGKSNVVLQAEKVVCVPCRKRSCANEHFMACMGNIMVESVLEEVERLAPIGLQRDSNCAN